MSGASAGGLPGRVVYHEVRGLSMRAAAALLALALVGFCVVAASTSSLSAAALAAEVQAAPFANLLSAPAPLTAAQALAQATSEAPVLSVSGETVDWYPVGSESSYTVAVSNDVRGAADRITHYITVPRVASETQSYTPTLSPGETAYIGVTANEGASWSAQEAAVTAPEPAPMLSVAGTTVQWHPVTSESSYEVAVSNDVRGAADRITHYITVPRVAGETQSYTPTLSPGETAYIGVTANEGASWSAQEAAVTAPEPEPEPGPERAPEEAALSPAAPVLSAHGDTLSWKALPGVTSYTLAAIHSPTTTRETTYTTVTGTSITPPVVPGQTVDYGLAAHAPVTGPWAREVAIAYPQSTPAEEPTSTPTEEPATNPSEAGAGTGELDGPFVKGITANFEGEGPNNVPEEVTEMHSLGVNWTREALDWSEMEPQKGVYDWASFDQVVAEAKANNISILPIVGYAPSWTSPTNAAAYAEFVAAAVARYGPGTNANLQWWELWNEPYFAYAWSGHTPEPEAYGRDALAAAEAAKKIAPTVKLLIAADYQEAEQTGGTSPTEQTWINDMFTAAPTLGKWIDGVSVHPYGGDPSTPLAQAGGYLDTSGQWGFQRIDTIREKFLAHGVNVPFWITEEGWSTWENSEATIAHNYADLITQIKTRPWIRALFPFGMREDDAHPTNNQPGFGLLKYGTREPKAAWTILQEGFKTLN